MVLQGFALLVSQQAGSTQLFLSSRGSAAEDICRARLGSASEDGCHHARLGSASEDGCPARLGSASRNKWIGLRNQLFSFSVGNLVSTFI